MLDEILTLLSAGAYWPALAAALLLATYAVRKLGADARLARWLRPWIPIGLSAAAFLIAWLTGAAGVAEAAAQSLAAAVAAIAGHDTAQALLALARALLGKPPAGELDEEMAVESFPAPALPPLGNRMQRAIRARAVLSGPLAAVLLPLAPLPALMLSGCITPRSAPLEPRPGISAKSIDASTAETLAECRRMRDRGILTGAGSAGAGALSAGLGALAIPADRERLQLGLGVGAAVTAAVGAGLALLSTQYGGAVKAHCSPWPVSARALPPMHPLTPMAGTAMGAVW
jgi:hypothetical protein